MSNEPANVGHHLVGGVDHAEHVALRMCDPAAPSTLISHRRPLDRDDSDVFDHVFSSSFGAVATASSSFPGRSMPLKLLQSDAQGGAVLKAVAVEL